MRFCEVSKPQPHPQYFFSQKCSKCPKNGCGETSVEDFHRSGTLMSSQKASLFGRSGPISSGIVPFRETSGRFQMNCGTFKPGRLSFIGGTFLLLKVGLDVSPTCFADFCTLFMLGTFPSRLLDVLFVKVGFEIRAHLTAGRFV